MVHRGRASRKRRVFIFDPSQTSSSCSYSGHFLCPVVACLEVLLNRLRWLSPDTLMQMLERQRQRGRWLCCQLGANVVPEWPKRMRIFRRRDDNSLNAVQGKAVVDKVEFKGKVQVTNPRRYIQPDHNSRPSDDEQHRPQRPFWPNQSQAAGVHVRSP